MSSIADLLQPSSPNHPTSRERAPTDPTPPPSKRAKPSPASAAAMSTSKQGPYPPGTSLSLDSELHGPIAPAAAAAAMHEAQAENTSLQVKLLRPEAKAPTRGSRYSAGYDVYVCEDAMVPKYGKAMLSTGIAVAIPPGTYARIAPRSGLAAKHSIATGAGVIDFDYRGEVKLVMFNHSNTDFEVKAGDRMAQMVLERIVNPELVVVKELDGTDRGAGGFGSTGGFTSAATGAAVGGSGELQGASMPGV